MIASGLMPRSPVWLRKIPSTVSGSQGSRRGLRPAVRFAFPLGARLNTTLRARPCQELFSESFCRPSRGPRGAPPSGLRPFAAASSVLYAPRAPRVRETRPHTGCRQLQRGGARADGVGRALRPAPHARPPGRPTQPHASSCLYIGRKIGHAFGPGVFRAAMQAALPCRRLSPVRFRQASRRGGSLPKEERPPPGPPAFRAGLLGNRHWSISSTSGRFRLFQYRYGLGTTEHFGRESISAAFGSTMYAQAPRPRSYNQKRREPLTQPSS